MIRKQFCITDAHERALKMKAGQMGVSEAELVRRLLDRLLLEGERSGVRTGGDRSGFLEATDRVAGSHRFSGGYRFDREELYGERGAGDATGGEPPLHPGLQCVGLRPVHQGVREAREGQGDDSARLAWAGSVALPAQALSEFPNVCFRKLEPPLAPEEVERLSLPPWL